MTRPPIYGGILFVSDIHLTDVPADQYRFGLADVLIKFGKDTGVRNVGILGDLTDSKDRHRGEFAHRIIAFLEKLSQNFDNVILLKGNHDYYDPKYPFFGFMDKVCPNLWYAGEPRMIPYEIHGETRKWIACFPHMGNTAEALPALLEKMTAKTIKDTVLVLTHHTFDGSLVENGMTLNSGLSPDIFKQYGFTCPIISGDIHVPQVVGKHLEYVGSPYHVHYGDSFEPRALYWDDEGKDTLDLSGEFPRRMRLEVTKPEQLGEFDIRTDDQIKVRLHLTKAEMVDWSKYKEEVKEYIVGLGAHLHGIEVKKLDEDRKTKPSDKLKSKQLLDLPDDQILERYSKKEKVDGALLDYGLEVVNANKKTLAP